MQVDQGSLAVDAVIDALVDMPAVVATRKDQLLIHRPMVILAERQPIAGIIDIKNSGESAPATPVHKQSDSASRPPTPPDQSPPASSPPYADSHAPPVDSYS